MVTALAESPLYVRKSTYSPNRKFSSTQFDLGGNVAIAIRELSDAIPDSDLAEDGREDKPHVTIKYGLHTSDADDVADVVRDFGPVEIKFGEVSVFPAKELSAQRGGDQYDVVKINIESDRLHELNELIGDSLKCTDTYPEYKPHATLAYVKPGEGAKYAGDKRFVGMDASFGTLTFSDLEHGKTAIWLEGEPIRRKSLRRSALYRRKSTQWDENKHARDAGKFSSQPGAGIVSPKPSIVSPVDSPDAKTQQYVSQLRQKFGDHAAAKVAAMAEKLRATPGSEAKIAALDQVAAALKPAQQTATEPVAKLQALHEAAKTDKHDPQAVKSTLTEMSTSMSTTQFKAVARQFGVNNTGNTKPEIADAIARKINGRREMMDRAKPMGILSPLKHL